MFALYYIMTFRENGYVLFMLTTLGQSTAFSV